MNMNRYWLLGCLVLLASCGTGSSTTRWLPGVATTTLSLLAGTVGTVGDNNGTGAAATFNRPLGVAVDGSGNVYVADQFNNQIRKIAPNGAVTLLAGSATGVAGSADGQGSSAKFNSPYGVAVDGAGNVYVADSMNFTIRKITPDGTVSTLAGSPGVEGYQDGSGVNATFSTVVGIAVDSSGDNIYVTDGNNYTIRKITSAGVVTTLAGSALNVGSSDGTGALASFDEPSGIAVDANGNLYVADWGDSTIRKITPAGVVTTLAGKANTVGHVDGVGAIALFDNPFGVAVDTSGNVFVSDNANATLRKITPAGVVTTVAGRSLENELVFGAGGTLNSPDGLAVDSSGALYTASVDAIVKVVLQ